jgi:hypothetical protein
MSLAIKLLTRRRVVWSLGTLIGLYAFLPIFAGLFRFSQPRGPVIYHSSYHHVLYDVGSCLVYGRGVRTPWTEIYYSRSPFYGWPETLIPRAERLKLVERGSVSPEIYARLESELEKHPTR